MVGTIEGWRPPPLSSEFFGIHELESLTVNTDSCDEEGLPTSSRNSLMMIEPCFLNLGTVSGAFIVATACDSVNDCQRLSCADGDFDESDSYVLATGDDAEGWSGEFVSAQEGVPGDPCEGTLIASTLNKNQDGALILEARFFQVEEVARTAEGFCDLEDAERQAADAPCDELAVSTLINQTSE